VHPQRLLQKKAGRSARKRLGVRPAPRAGLLVMRPSGLSSHHRLLLLRPIRCPREKGSNHPPPAAPVAPVKGLGHGTQSYTPCTISELVCADLSLMQQALLPATHAPRADRCCVGQWPKQASHHSTPMLYTMDQTDSAQITYMDICRTAENAIMAITNWLCAHKTLFCDGGVGFLFRAEARRRREGEEKRR
jgi:hypothetical protein